jgi:hypothetical protein
MTDPLRDSIVEAMTMKETDELVKIWQVHDPEEWTETAYDVIAEILQDRLGEVPPITGMVEKEVEEEEIPECNGERSPEFYDPSKVLKLEKWIDYAIYVSIASAFFSVISQSSTMYSLVGSYFNYRPEFNVLVVFISILIVVLQLAFDFVIVYFLFKALKYILQILMEMEFKSR